MERVESWSEWIYWGGALAVLIPILLSYALQTIADKVGIPHSWLAYVPLLQLYLALRVGNCSPLIVAFWVLSGVTLAVLTSLLQTLGIGIGLPLLCFGLWLLWGAMYLAFAFFRMAANRGLSGTVGLLCGVPVLGVFVFLYIAFYDGFVRPHWLGIGLALLLFGLPVLEGVSTLKHSQPEVEALVADVSAFNQAIRNKHGQITLQKLKEVMESSGLTAAVENIAGKAAASDEPSRAGAVGGVSKRLIEPSVTEQSAEPAPALAACPPGTVPREGTPPKGTALWCRRVEESAAAKP